MKDRETNQVLTQVMDSISKATLHTFVDERTETDTKVHTDDHAGYRGLPNHETVWHGVGEYVRGKAYSTGMESH